MPNTITNAEIAAILSEMSKMLELRDGNKFKITAYQNAAEVIKKHPIEISNVLAKSSIKEVEEISGIGPGIGEKIEELISTGEVKSYEKLKKQNS